MDTLNSVNSDDKSWEAAINSKFGMGNSEFSIVGCDEDSKLTFTDEKPIPNDESIDKDSLTTLLKAELLERGISGSHLVSINSFYRVGINQIITKIFKVRIENMKNLRDKTEEDRSIDEISLVIEFTDVSMKKPTYTLYRSGEQQLLTPNTARQKDLNYTAPLMVSADIKATALTHDGKLIERTASVKDFQIASIPVIVGSELCNTYGCSRDMLKAMQEDPDSPGGYVITRGKEWGIENLENIQNNKPHVHKNMYGEEIARATIISKPGDAFENSYQIIVRLLNSGEITVEISTGILNKVQIPFYLIFRMFGMTRDRDMVDHIIYGYDNTDAVSVNMKKDLEIAFNTVNATFKDVYKSNNVQEILEHTSIVINDFITNNNYKKDENANKYVNIKVLKLLDKHFLPHVGNDAESRFNKLRFLGHLIHKLLRVKQGILDSTDRDSYVNKRLHAAGYSIAKTFKTQFNFIIVQELRKHLVEDFKRTPFSQVQLAASFTSAIKPKELGRLLMQSITTGNKTITIKRNEVANRISSQQLDHGNDLNIKAQLRSVVTMNTSSSKQTTRAEEMRRVHNTYPGYICPIKSKDTGEKVGMTKELACSAFVCLASSSVILKKTLLDDELVIKLDDVSPSRIHSEKLTKVFVNGDWIGLTADQNILAYKYRMIRRQSDFEGKGIHPYTTIVTEVMVREIHFWVDVGRVLRPLIIVYNNLPEYMKSVRAGKPIKFRQWTKLKQEHLYQLRAKKLTMDDLRTMGVIEYISAEEQVNAYLAVNYNVFIENQNNVEHPYSHCDIEQSVLGLLALSSPNANHTNSTRTTYHTNQKKSTSGWFLLNWPYRVDKNTVLQHYCEKPNARVFTDTITHPIGQNAMVALMCYSGYNVEDSGIICKQSIDRGLFNGSKFYYEQTILEKDEQFGNPDKARTLDRKPNNVYDYITDNFIRKGTLVHKGYVLAVKVAKIQKSKQDVNSRYIYVDKSLVYKFDEPAYVEDVIKTRNEDDMLMVKVKLRMERPMRVGDKMSSRTGNKSICGLILNQEDMPYTEDGLTPDIIVNPHSIPTRMAIGQIIASVMAAYGVRVGNTVDATIFKSNDIDKIIEGLGKYGVKNKGMRRMYNGKTGDWLDTLIFIFPSSYQRLQKFVLDDSYSISQGPTSALTRQPLDGKINNGGLRIGELMTWVYASHGSMRALFEKMNNDSDGFEIPICRLCKTRAIVSEERNIYKCKTCGDDADIAMVPTCWMSNVFMHTIEGMGGKIKTYLSPYEITY